MHGGDAHGQGLEQYVVFRLGQEKYGIAIQNLEEIIRVPCTVRVPLAPPHVRGLTNLRGTILPVYDLRAQLGVSGTADDESGRVIVVSAGGRRAGYVVDQVDGVVDITSDVVEEFRAAKGNDACVARAARLGDGQLVLIVEVEKMLSQADLMVRKDTAGETVLGSTEAGGARALGGEQQFLTFRIGREEYALDIADVQEIVHMPETYSTVPDAPPYVLGLVTLRDRVLPVVSMRRLLGLGGEVVSEGRLVVAYVGEARKVPLGLLVDSVAEVLRVEEKALEAVPAVIQESAKELKAVCRLSEERIVFVLDASKLLADADFLKAWEDQGTGEQAEIGRGSLEEEYQLVTFLVDKEEFALPVDCVREIIREGRLTFVPKTRAYVRGVLNLRGTIVPVVDLRSVFGHEGRKDDFDGRILICEGDASIIGLIVDGVKEVAKIGASRVEDAPSIIGKGDAGAYVTKVAKFTEERNVMLLDPARVLNFEIQ
ncbi:MAG: purine-binding chemotaxis protein CheW [Bacillota bacterium]|nr:purine-binding chemotaxis protein CheW [Bacillota bacterium]MDK2925263.1 purine-binding chemotaxis protein CheW [Bacillota bacterium]MDK2960463.1 purine-binding chemotaxis protein CheW [Bacillota bacterium]